MECFCLTRARRCWKKEGACVVNLIAKPPVEMPEPIQIGAAELSLIDYGALTSIAPFVQAAVAARLDPAWPAPGRATGKLGARCIFWLGLLA